MMRHDSGLRCVLRSTAVTFALTLAGCGGSQNWSQPAVYLTVGGQVSGLNGGTVALSNNGTDSVSVAKDGAFRFALSIAPNTAYNVTVKTQPTTATCSVSNGSGTATTNVDTVSVACLPNVSIGGSVTGLGAGQSVVLADNGTDTVTVSANGAFTFATPLAHGASYAVTVKTQPSGGYCQVANGAGSANGTVSNVLVSCQVFVLRPLPASYLTAKAIAYGPSRAGGPPVGEHPTDAQILQDLGLMNTAGYTLIRLFGADAVAESILRLAQANYPNLQFHVGAYLEGAPSSCVDTVNQTQLSTLVHLATAYPNVAVVSVGNETSFAGNLPVSCLVSYVQSVRSQVTQPVTADDDYTFYAGQNGAEKPDLVLPTIDFVSMHTYPISNSSRWDWEQLAVASGAGRATAMMNAAIANAQSTYAAVGNYLYKDASGNTVSIGASLPIVVGETGWKARQTRTSSSIELYAANPVNEKWYLDLLTTWKAGANGPANVFVFEAFDEAWKGEDDGWGLWDASRNARYALCGTPAGSACNADVYAGAGYYP
jgi:exo-beta-1,3-glucanase (GH17 family)